MQVFRHIYSVNHNKIVIEFPPDFNHDSVEVIVLPVTKAKSRKHLKPTTSNKNKQLKELLAVGVWNEKDLQPVVESNNLINQCNIEQF
ncbi:MAG: hypothetical protein NT004_10690 [Bacteroidetes bacterium]|nr:hypothetical protein [Bacteroidota bacterium]